jgi:hypothetical protein
MGCRRTPFGARFAPVPRQNSGTFEFHLGNNVTNLSCNSLIFKVARHFGEAHLQAPIYKGFPHGMPTTEAETINADLLAFLKGVFKAAA